MKKFYFILSITLWINLNAQVTDVISSLDHPASIAIYNNELYIAEDKKISKIDLADTNPNPENVLTGLTSGGAYLLLHGDDLYISIYAGGKILKMDLSEDNPTPVEIITGLFGANGMFIKDNLLYITVSTQDKISVVDLSQANPVATDFVTGLDFPNAIYIEGNNLYIAEVSGDKISKVDLSDSQPSPIDVVIDLDAPSLGLLVIDNELYFSQYGGNKVSKININVNNPTVTDIATGLNGPAHLLQQGSDLFVAVSEDNKISKIENSILSTSELDRHNGANITLYPNPTLKSISLNGIQHVQTGTLFSFIGGKILEFQAKENSPLNVQHLDAGVYYLVLENGWTKKFIKK